MEINFNKFLFFYGLEMKKKRRYNRKEEIYMSINKAITKLLKRGETY